MKIIEDIKVCLTSSNTIEVNVRINYQNAENKIFDLYDDQKFVEHLSCISKTKTNKHVIYTLLSSVNLEVGHLYLLKDDFNDFFPVDVSYLSTRNEFYEKYKYDGQLGAIYTKERTTFRVFSPLSTEICLQLEHKGKKQILVMDRKDNGVYEITLEGDYDKASYLYLVNMMGRLYTVVDPYAKSLNTNSQKAYVIDTNKIKKIKSYYDKLTPVKSYSDHIIYETSVRDLTSLTDVENRGTYTAFTKEGSVDKNNNPIGMDYLKNLGVTTVQVLPIYDFQTVDESNMFLRYNWGYDPKFYFGIEGSMSINPEDPYQRLIEVKNMISTLHKNNIRLTMDVVYNHVFSAGMNSLELLCPNYYFRKNNDGSYSNGSCCGNDVESRHYMTRKLILESLEYFVDVFDVDGFRFDLMGIIDKETITLAYQRLSKLKKDIILYGEGWDMMTNMPSDMKSSMNNAFSLPHIGFFNDRFRDISKGKSSENELATKGYLTNDTNYIDGFKHVYLGSCVPISYPPLFINANQSINYVECHDNGTLFDKLGYSNKEDSLTERLKRINLINSCVMFSHGVPFFHMGQEVGLTKNNHNNSYNAGDEINGMKYDVAYSRREMLKYFKDLTKIRKELPIFKITEKDELMKIVSFINLDKGALLIKYTYKDCEYYIIYNPSKETFTYNFDNYVKILFNNSGIVSSDYDFFSQIYQVPPLSVSILFAQK